MNDRLPASYSVSGLAKGKIISVVDKLIFEGYLRYAGADYVLSPKHTTGTILARNAVLNLSSEDPGHPGIGQDKNKSPSYGRAAAQADQHPGCLRVQSAAFKSLGELDLFERFGIIVPFLWKAGKFIPDPGDDIVIDNTTSSSSLAGLNPSSPQYGRCSILMAAQMLLR
jgi:voltage-gated potassium channel